MSNQYNISGIQGSTLNLSLSCTDSTGGFLNLTNYSISGYVKQKYASTGKLFDLSVSITSAVSGLITISGSANDLASANVGIYVYNIEAKNGDYIFKPLGGYFYIFPEATNL